MAAVLNVGAISGSPAVVWSIEATADSDPLVDNLIVIDSTTGVVSWTYQTAGTYIFTVTVTNSFGCVFGQQEVTLTIANC